MSKKDKSVQQDWRTVAEIDLERKGRGALVEISKALEPPLILKKTWTGKQIARKIYERRVIEDKARSQTISTSAHDSTGDTHSIADAATVLQPVNTDFEAAAQAKAIEEEPKKRGGYREGAGRPPGLTDEKARAKNLPKYPNIAIKQGVEWLFELWASAMKIELLALDENEAMLLSLPITQIQEYFFPGFIPEIAGAFVMLIYATTKITKPRFALIRELHKAKAEGRDISTVLSELKNDAKTGHTVDNRQNGQRKNS